MLKEEIIPILHNLFQRTAKKEYLTMLLGGQHNPGILTRTLEERKVTNNPSCELCYWNLKSHTLTALVTSWPSRHRAKPWWWVFASPLLRLPGGFLVYSSNLLSLSQSPLRTLRTVLPQDFSTLSTDISHPTVIFIYKFVYSRRLTCRGSGESILITYVSSVPSTGSGTKCVLRNQ